MQARMTVHSFEDLSRCVSTGSPGRNLLRIQATPDQDQEIAFDGG